MGKIEVFQRHIADIVVIRNTVGFRMGIAVCIRPCVGFCPVSGFDNDLFGKDILFIEQHLKCPLYLVQRELALVKSREDGDQNIGIMLDVIQIEVILVIVVSAFVGVELALQLCLHAAILFLRTQHRIILTEIGRSNHG